MKDTVPMTLKEIADRECAEDEQVAVLVILARDMVRSIQPLHSLELK